MLVLKDNISRLLDGLPGMKNLEGICCSRKLTKPSATLLQTECSGKATLLSKSLTDRAPTYTFKMFSEGWALKNWICPWLGLKVLWLRGDDASQAKLDGRLFSTVTLLSTCLDKTVFWVFCQQTTKTRQTNDQKQRRKLLRILNLDFDQQKKSKIGVQISILQFGRQCLKCCSRFERSQCLQFHWNVFAKTSHWVQFSPLHFCWVIFWKMISALNHFQEKVQTLKLLWKFVNPISALNYFYELCGRHNIPTTTLWKVAVQWCQIFWVGGKQLEL